MNDVTLGDTEVSLLDNIYAQGALDLNKLNVSVFEEVDTGLSVSVVGKSSLAEQ